LYISASIGYAQFPSELWHEGKIVLVKGDTIRGNIKYDLERDIVQINNQQGTEAYTAKKMLYFNFIDETTRQYRQFYALPYSITTEYKTPIFFEVFFEGKMTLLAREFITIKTTSFGGAGLGGNSYSRQVLAYRYYFLDDRGKIVRYQGNKRQLYQILKNRETEVKQFIKNNRLKYDDKSDMILLTEYYNTLISPKDYSQ
jgi:hypothetical protein